MLLQILQCIQNPATTILQIAPACGYITGANAPLTKHVNTLAYQSSNSYYYCIHFKLACLYSSAPITGH